MARQRDYQPTIDRQRVQVADLKRQVGEQRAAAKDAQRDVSHLRYALQCANEDADNARLTLLVQDSLVADLKADLAAEVEKVDQLQRLVAELTPTEVFIKAAVDVPSFIERWREIGRRCIPGRLTVPNEST